MKRKNKKDLYPHDKYREILVLEHLIEQESIPFEIRADFDGFSIAIPYFRTRSTITATQNMMTYDSNLDLLEVVDLKGRQHIDMSADAAMMIIRDEYRNYIDIEARRSEP